MTEPTMVEFFVENGPTKVSARIPAEAFASVHESAAGRAVLDSLSALATAPPPVPAQAEPPTLPTQVFVVGRACEKGPGIECVLGVFLDFDLAVAQCVSPLDFVGPLLANTINTAADWAGIIFPRRPQRGRNAGGAQ